MSIINSIIEKIEIGKQHEVDLLPRIKKILELDTIRGTPRYTHYDYTATRGKTRYWIELKQRNINYKQYNTIIINTCKMNCFRKGLKRGNRCWAFWLLKDGLYGLEFTKDNIDSFSSRPPFYGCAENISDITDINMDLLQQY